MSHDTPSFESELLSHLARIADALEAAHIFRVEQAAKKDVINEQMDQLLKTAQTMVERPPGMPSVLVLSRDAERGMCPRTGESCERDCGIGGVCAISVEASFGTGKPS